MPVAFPAQHVGPKCIPEEVASPRTNRGMYPDVPVLQRSPYPLGRFHRENMLIAGSKLME